MTKFILTKNADLTFDQHYSTLCRRYFRCHYCNLSLNKRSQLEFTSVAANLKNRMIRILICKLLSLTLMLKSKKFIGHLN